MANRWVRSLFWLVSCTGLGYGLLLVAKPSEAEIQKIRQINPVEKNYKEVKDKNQQFMNVLQAATVTDKPIYRLTKEEIEKEIKKNY